MAKFAIQKVFMKKGMKMEEQSGKNFGGKKTWKHTGRQIKIDVQFYGQDQQDLSENFWITDDQTTGSQI